MANIPQLTTELAEILKTGDFSADAPMGAATSFRLGGRADYLIEPGDEAEFIGVLALLRRFGVPFFVMGNGTNLLVRDGGFRGAAVRLGRAMGAVSAEGTEIRAQAGALLSEVAAAAAAASLTGLEFAAGIPGSVGGAIYMNAGAYGGEVGQTLKTVRVLYEAGGTARDGREAARGFAIEERSREEMGFGYRRSALATDGGIALEAVFALERGDGPRIREKMRELALRRKEKQPLDLPSAGSFFKRPPGHFAGKLIEDAGLAGLRLGGAQVSPLHAGFIVNTGRASARDVIDLMEVVRSTVFLQSGVMLEPEVRIIGEISDDL
ncbi:MAG: UDP-N-acetylmuramate dehydrogenase [Clostridiales Family XIII bacterium]|jgi:UDP-N-acetylmuramate dehydrogenase|nr:UDP-N-acetylmuramate dehydrogenase [Clostridiales Family XIII bacterium]